ncbi:MAG: AgmX/PglI C-terminal domain-containing protein [bacterium]
MHRLILVLAVVAPSAAVAQTLPQTTPESAIRQTFDDAKARFHKCYVDHVPAASRVNNGDNARLNFRILDNGRVDGVYFVDTTLVQEQARTCVLDVARTLDFRVRSAEAVTINVYLGLDSKLHNVFVRLLEPVTPKVSPISVIQDHADDFTGCFDDLVSRTKTAEAKIRFKVTISAGSVQSAEASSQTGGDDAFRACMVSRLQQLKFPSTDGEIAVLNVPFSFSTK